MIQVSDSCDFKLGVSQPDINTKTGQILSNCIKNLRKVVHFLSEAYKLSIYILSGIYIQYHRSHRHNRMQWESFTRVKLQIRRCGSLIFSFKSKKVQSRLVKTEHLIHHHKKVYVDFFKTTKMKNNPLYSYNNQHCPKNLQCGTNINRTEMSKNKVLHTWI